MPLDIANSYLLKYNKRKRGTPKELNQVGADVSSAGIDKGHVLEPDSDAIVYFHTENGNDITGDGSRNNPYRSYFKAQTIEAGDPAKTTIEQINDYPIFTSFGPITSDLQFTTANAASPVAFTNAHSGPAHKPIDIKTLSDGTTLALTYNSGQVLYYLQTAPQVAYTGPIAQNDSYVTSNNPEKIFIINDEFYLFYADKTYKAGNNGVFDELSVAHAKAYDMTTTSQYHIKVTDATPAVPDDVATWGTTGWGNGSWRSNVGLKGLVLHPLNFSSKIEIGIPSEFDDDESITCITSDSNDRVWIGTSNPDSSSGNYSGRIFYSDDLKNWTLSKTINNPWIFPTPGISEEGIIDIVCTKSDILYAYYLNTERTRLLAARKEPGYIGWTNELTFSVGSTESIFRINITLLDNAPFVYSLEQPNPSGDPLSFRGRMYRRTAPSSSLSETIFSLSVSNAENELWPCVSYSTVNNDYHIQVLYDNGYYNVNPTNTVLGNVANGKFIVPQTGKVYNGCSLTSRSISNYTIQNSIITSPTGSNLTVLNSHIEGNAGNLSNYTVLTNSRVGSLNYDITSNITGLTVDSLSQSTVNVLNATRCKFLAQNGTVTLAGGATLTECYFAGTWQHAIANGQTYSINHCTWNGSAEFNTATAPTAWTSENCIFLNLTFPDITAGNEVDILYGGIVGTLTGVNAGENVRRDNPLFAPGTDGKLQRTLDGFLQDSPYIRQASDTNASTGANKDLGAYNIDDSLIVADYGTSVYLPKPPGDSITITETPLASVHTAISGQPDVFNDPTKRTEQVEITYTNINNDVYEVYQEIETNLENMSVYLALDPYYLTELPTVTTSAAASAGQTFIEVNPATIFAGSRFTLVGTEYFIRYRVLNSSNQTTRIVLDRPLESAVSFGSLLELTHPVGTGEYQYIPQPRTFTRADSQDMEVKGPFKVVLVRKPE